MAKCLTSISLVNPHPMTKKILYSLYCSAFFLSLSAQNALNFDGVDDRVNCGNNVSLQLSGNAISLEAWIYPTAWSAQVWQGNIINKENNAPDYGYMLRCGDNGRLNFNIGSGSWNELSSAPNTLTLNTWQHVAGTYDGTKIRLYVNGLLVDSQNVSANFSSGLQNLTIGNWSNTTNRPFMGSIDEVRVWNIVRSRAEIANNMNTEFCTAPAGLVAYYQLNEGLAGQGNSGVITATDLSANANNGTLNNFTLSGSASNWVGGSNISPASDFVQIIDSTCTDYLGPLGTVYDSTGIYLDTLQNSDGCDSIIETNLTVNSVDNGVTANSNILVAQQANALYQWLDCNNANLPLSGATNQLLSPPDPLGSYAVIVDYRGCIDTSDCFSLTGIGLSEASYTALELYPNPSEGLINIEHPQLIGSDLSIRDIEGRLIFNLKQLDRNSIHLDMSELASGKYILNIENEDFSLSSTLIID